MSSDFADFPRGREEVRHLWGTVRMKKTQSALSPKRDRIPRVSEDSPAYKTSTPRHVDTGLLPGFPIADPISDHSAATYAVENAFRRYGIEGEDVFLALAARCVQAAQARHREFAFFPYERALQVLDIVAHDRQLESLLDRSASAPSAALQLPVWYQYFVGRRFREGSGKFFTPRNVARSMANLLPLHAGVIIADPTCGGGTFLSEVGKLLQGSPCTLVGNDVDRMLVGLTEVVLTLACGTSQLRDLYCNNLYDRGPFIDAYGGRVDCILANPPFSLDLDAIGLKSSLFNMGYRNSDAVFLDVCMSLLKEGGHLVCLLPHSIIVNTEYAKLRAYVERAWDLCGVITLPEGIFYMTANTTTRADILHLRKKSLRHPSIKKVYFANAPAVGIPMNSRDRNTSENALEDIAVSICARGHLTEAGST